MHGSTPYSTLPPPGGQLPLLRLTKTVEVEDVTDFVEEETEEGAAIRDESAITGARIPKYKRP